MLSVALEYAKDLLRTQFQAGIITDNGITSQNLFDHKLRFLKDENEIFSSLDSCGK